MVEQARGNNKEISFSEDFAGSAIEWHALFSGRTCPFACTGIKKIGYFIKPTVLLLK
jgi:hypothetical protein